VRLSLHFTLRLATALTCTSSAAAFDAAHNLHPADVISRRGHSLGVRWHEARPNSHAATIDCTFLGNRQPRNKRPQFNQAEKRRLENNA